MNETERTKLSDEVKRLAIDLLSNETLVVRLAARNSTPDSTRSSTQSIEQSDGQGRVEDDGQDGGQEGGQDGEQEVLFYGRTEIGGDTVSIVNDGSQAIARLCSSLLTASAVNRQAGWNFICKALS
jgi:hypothetical protein